MTNFKWMEYIIGYKFQLTFTNIINKPKNWKFEIYFMENNIFSNKKTTHLRGFNSIF
jgi:hypothetical protein